MSSIEQEFYLIDKYQLKKGIDNDTLETIRLKTERNNSITGNMQTTGPCQDTKDSYVRFNLTSVGKHKLLTGDIECVQATDDSGLDTQWMITNQPFMNFPDTSTIQSKNTFFAQQTKYLIANKMSNQLSTLNRFQDMWQTDGDLTKLIGDRWCTNGPRGDRNKTLLANWLGPSCINFLYTHGGYGGIDSYELTGKESYQTQKCWFTLWMMKGLMQSPGFYPFLNPMEHIGVAMKYPNSYVLSLDFSRVGGLLSIQIDGESSYSVKDQKEKIYRFELEDMFAYFFNSIAVNDNNSTTFSIKNLKGMSRYLLLSIWLKNINRNNTSRLLITGLTNEKKTKNITIGAEPFHLDSKWCGLKIPNVPDKTIRDTILTEIDTIQFESNTQYSTETVLKYYHLIGQRYFTIPTAGGIDAAYLDNIRSTFKNLLFKNDKFIPNGISYTAEFFQKEKEFLTELKDANTNQQEIVKKWLDSSINTDIVKGDNIFAIQIFKLWSFLETSKIDNYNAILTKINESIKSEKNRLDTNTALMTVMSTIISGSLLFTGSIGIPYIIAFQSSAVAIHVYKILTEYITEKLTSFWNNVSFDWLFTIFRTNRKNATINETQKRDEKVNKRIKQLMEKTVSGRDLTKSLKWLLREMYLPFITQDFMHTVSSINTNPETENKIKIYTGVAAYEFEKYAFIQGGFTKNSDHFGLGPATYKLHIMKFENVKTPKVLSYYDKIKNKALKHITKLARKARNTAHSLGVVSRAWDYESTVYDDVPTLNAINSKNTKIATRNITQKLANGKQLGAVETMFALQNKIKAVFDDPKDIELFKKIISTYLDDINEVRNANNLKSVSTISEAWQLNTLQSRSSLLRDSSPPALIANIPIPESNYLFHRFNRQSIEPKEYFEAVYKSNFNKEGCNNSDPTNPHHNSAFRVDNKGNVVASCGKDGWITDTSNIPNVIPEMDDFNNQLIQAITTLGQKVWKMSVYNKIQLWRWMGIECMGVSIVNQVINSTMGEVKSKCKQINGVQICSLEEQLSMLNKYKKVISKKRNTSGCEDTRQKRCIVRLKFLQQMMNSFIFYPFLRDQNEALEKWGQNRILPSGYNQKNRVIVTLDWSKSGRVAFIKAGSYTTKFCKVCEIVTHGDLQLNKFIPSLVRFKALQLFRKEGGIVARNIDYHQEKFNSTSISMVLFAFLKQLPTIQDQMNFANNVLQPIQNGVTLDSNQNQMFINAQNNYKSLMNFNLNARQKNILGQILKLEQTHILTESDIQTSTRLESKLKQSSDGHISSLKNKRIIRDCQDPSMVPLLRQKVKDLYGDTLDKNPDTMTRKEICETLMGGQVTIAYPTIPWWSIVNVPVNLQINGDSKLIDIYTEDNYKKSSINDYLITNYAVTLEEMVKSNNQNDQSDNIEKLTKYELGLETNNKQYDDILNTNTKFQRFKTFVLSGFNCKDLTDDDKKQYNADNLCDATNGRVNITPMDLLQRIFKSLEQSENLESSNDLYFIDVASNILIPFYNTIRKQGSPAITKTLSLDKRKKQNNDILNLLDNELTNSTNNQYINSDLVSYFKSNEFQNINNQWKLFEISNKDNIPVAQPFKNVVNIDEFDIVNNFYIQFFQNKINNLPELVIYTLLFTLSQLNIVKYPSN